MEQYKFTLLQFLKLNAIQRENEVTLMLLKTCSLNEAIGRGRITGVTIEREIKKIGEIITDDNGDLLV